MVIFAAKQAMWDPVWKVWQENAPFSAVPVFWFIFVYCLTSFTFWLVDIYDRRDLKIQKHKKIPNLSEVFPNVFLNLFIIGPLYGVFMDSYFEAKPNWEPLTLFEWALNFIIAVVSVDVIFYWTHRLMHIPFFYKWFHKRHHEMHSPIAFSAVYAHWVEHIFVNVTSSMIAQYYIANSRFTTVWCCIAAFKTCQGHSGYDFAWIGRSWNFHDLHHECPTYNYGSGALMIFDRIFGSLKHRDEIPSLVRASKNAKVA